MKFLVYGAGVIGTIFAVKLSDDGHDITMLARNTREQELRQFGAVLRNPGTDEKETAKVNVISSLPEDSRYDYILVVMQRTQVHEVLESLASSQCENIVFIVNTASGYEQWKDAVGAERLMIGFPASGGERKDGEVFYFVSKGLMRVFQTTTFGELSGQKTQRVIRLIQAFRSAGIPSVFCRDMDAWQKTHVALVTSIADALYRHGCDNQSLSGSWKDIRDMLLEIKLKFRALNKIGIRITPSKLNFFFLPVFLLSPVFRLFMGTKLAEITMAKHCIAAKPEMEYLKKEYEQLVSRTDSEV